MQTAMQLQHGLPSLTPPTALKVHSLLKLRIVGLSLQGREPVGLLESGEVVCSRGIKPALEEQKSALRMERFQDSQEQQG